MLCANCDNTGVFTTMTAIGEKAFCCEACYAEYVGLPIKEEGYYGLASETFEADEDYVMVNGFKWEWGMAYIAPTELIKKRLKEAGFKLDSSDKAYGNAIVEFYKPQLVAKNGNLLDVTLSLNEEYDGFSRLTFYDDNDENTTGIAPPMDWDILYEKGLLKGKDFVDNYQSDFYQVYWEGLYDELKDSQKDSQKESHNCSDNADLEIYEDDFIVMECNICGRTATFRQETSFYGPRNAETFEASIVNRGKTPKGAVEKAMMNHAMIERAKLESVIQELENKVQLGIISEEDLMKSLTQRFGADFEVIDWNNLHDTNRELFVQKTQEYYNDFKENNPKLHEDFEENVMNEESWYGYERGKSYAETKEKWTKKLSDLGYEYERIDDYWEYIGYENTSHYVPCNNCEGEGIIITKYYPATREDPADADYVDCEMCEGKGKVLEEMNAETKKEKLSKTSCCCGATESNPCACMKAPKPMNCSATEPKCQCYKDLEKNAETFESPSDADLNFKITCPNCHSPKKMRAIYPLSDPYDPFPKYHKPIFYCLHCGGREGKMTTAQIKYDLKSMDELNPNWKEVFPIEKYRAETFDVEEGDDCPNCYCEHQNLSLDGTPSVDEEYVSVNVVCDDCGMKGYTTTYPYEWDNEAKLEDVGLPLAVNMYNPNYGELRCSRCRERFEKSAENYVLDVE